MMANPRLLVYKEGEKRGFERRVVHGKFMGYPW